VNDAGGAVAVTLTLGFQPRYFRVVNITDRISYEWFEGMTNPGALKQVAAGTGTLETTEAPTVSARAPHQGSGDDPSHDHPREQDVRVGSPRLM
jgi:hypothetical protein